MGQAPDSLLDPSNASNAPRLIDRFRAAIHSRHYGRRTEEIYVHGIKRYIYFYGKRHLRTDVSTKMIYTYVLNKGGRGVKSPLDSGGVSQPPVARDVTAEYRV